MPKYRWKCLACDSGNNPEESFCQSCGYPAETNGALIGGWKNSLTAAPEKPTLNLNKFAVWGEFGLLNNRTAPCPRCNLHMYITDSKCPHCYYTLKVSERHNLASKQKATFNKGRSMALIFYPILILLCLGISYAYKNF